MENHYSDVADTQSAGSCNQDTAWGAESVKGERARWDFQWDRDEDEACFIRSSN
jgi:hypothetical protein